MRTTNTLQCENIINKLDADKSSSYRFVSDVQGTFIKKNSGNYSNKLTLISFDVITSNNNKLEYFLQN